MVRRILALAALATMLSAGCVPIASADPSTVPVGLALAANDSEFIPATLVAPARMPVTVMFQNYSNEPHTLIFLEPISVNPEQVVEPGQSLTVAFSTPAAGEYTFLCNVHEGMTGTLRIN